MGICLVNQNYLLKDYHFVYIMCHTCVTLDIGSLQTARSREKKLPLIKTKTLQTAIFNKENIGKLERNKIQ